MFIWNCFWLGVDKNLIPKLGYLNFQPSLKLWWCSVRDLLKFINNTNIDGSCLNRIKLHLNKSGTALLVKNFSQALKPNWLCSINHSVTDKTTNSASANNTSNISLLRNLRMKNPKNIVFSYININSIRNKFDNICDLILKNVDILSVAETKVDSPFLICSF